MPPLAVQDDLLLQSVGYLRGLKAERSRVSTSELLDMLALFVFMVGISSTLEVGDIIHKMKSPKPMVVGLLGQYVVLPAIAYGASRAFELSSWQTIALLAMCCSPGGTASNILCHMFKADVALSISLTTISSFMAFAFLPLNMMLYLGRNSDAEYKVHGWDLSKFTVVVVVGTLLGLFLERYGAKFLLKTIRFLGTLSTIYLLASSIVQNATSSQPFWKTEVSVILSILMPIVAGHFFGFLGCFLMKVEFQSCVAVALEVSIQNKLLALGLVGVILSGSKEMDENAVLEHKDVAASAKAIPLMYGSISITLNLIALILYWKMGLTKLNPKGPWYSPLKGLVLKKIESVRLTESKVASGTRESSRVAVQSQSRPANTTNTE